MDLLAAIAADPTLLPLWAVMLFAAGMYPIGMIFGCTPCCNPDPCVCASGSTLPETITVTLDGFEDYETKSYLTSLSFSSCYGTGAAGRVESPGQSEPGSDIENDRGPVAAVSLSSGGSGYAKLGRAAPTVTVTGTSGSGTGATFNVTLATSKNSCGLDRWAVSKITTNGGDGYKAGDWLTLSIANGDTQEVAAAATIAGPAGVPSSNGYFRRQVSSLSFSACYGSGGSGVVDAPENEPGPITAVSLTDGGSGYAKLGRAAPTVTVTGTSGSGTGATFNVTLASSKDSCGLDLWAVSKVTATGGEGYIEGEELTFSVAEGDTQETAAIATIQLGRVAPTVTVTGTSGSGSGATFDVTLAQSQGTDGRDRWAVSKVTMTGGTGYETFDTLTFGIAEGDTEEQAAYAQLIIGKAQPTLTLPGNATGTVSTQPIGDGTYAVSAVTVTSGGSGYTDGEYLFFDKAADDVTVFNATAIARVAYTEPQNATVSVSSSGGSGAVLEPVWALTEAPEWYAPNVKVYRLAGVTVVNGGTGYADHDPISISFPSAADGAQLDFDSLDADIVGPNGEIQQVYIEPTDGGQWRGARTDALESVELGQGGSYYKDDPNAREVFVIGGGVYYREDQNSKTVSVSNGGKYYREDASLPPYVATVTVTVNQTTPNAGVGAVISATVSDDTQSQEFGKITGLSITNGGSGYVGYQLEAMQVNISSGGVYYREDAELPPYVASVSIGINQTQPSNGSGAIISATIDSDTSSESFGEITGLTVTNGGNGYLAYHWTGQNCVGHYLNGKGIVLRRVVDANADYCFQLTTNWPIDNSEPNNKNLRRITFPLLDTSPPVFGVPRNDKIVASCVYAHRFCGGWTDPFLASVFSQGVFIDYKPQEYGEKILLVGFNGEGKPAVARLADDCGASLSAAGASAGSINQEWVSDTPIETCSQFEWSKTNANGVSISVLPGGDYDPGWRFRECNPAAGNCKSCNVCCQGDGERPDEIEVVIADEWTADRPAGLPDFSGTYVAPLWWSNYWVFSAGGPITNVPNVPGFESFGFGLGLYPCHKEPSLFSPAGATCNTCIKQCRTHFGSLGVQWRHPQFPSIIMQRTASPTAPSDACGECEDTPVCSPSSKEFPLFYDGTRVATATIQ